ncbi:protein abrupt isoform X2 [Eurosta solidaginis]|uniref:protein abrupt isoform X2 n=1 Tax=Eurosta solidaginis TaxID=178769 RepID=UPI003530BB8C
MAAENYHLKWDSHLSYLNSSIATLYKNEKFADVVLYSSSTSSGGNGNSSDGGIPTVGISAHKFILSSCSQFFATMFETAPISSPNGVLYVVLPPDLSHRAIQILVQYMYSGEATVANDILNEVLRGGEILKIRGLCRTSSSSSSQNPIHRGESLITNGGGSHYIQNAANRQQSLPSISHSHIPSAHSSDMYVINKSRTRYPMEHLSHATTHPSQTLAHHVQPVHSQFRGLGASVLPKDSPVIVKSPKLSQLGLLSAVAASSSKHQSGAGITVNKEVAIDPEEKCCYQLNNVPVSTSLCNEIGCSGGCPMSVDEDQKKRRQRNQNDETNRTTVVEQQLEREYSERPGPPPDEQDQREDIEMVNYDKHTHLGCGSGGITDERVREYYLPESYERTNSTSTKNKNSFNQHNGTLKNISPIMNSQNFVTIKQEPDDWITSATDSLSGRPKTPLSSPKQPLDFKMPVVGTTVKLEVNTHPHSPPNELDVSAQEPGDYETHLECEKCKQSFDEPKSWVSHLESHATNTNTTATTTSIDSGTINMTCNSKSTNGISVNAATSGGDSCAKAYVPKKRRRVSQQENNAGHVTLCCDLCSISFDTPADWVRHINNEHTEIELAMFNSKKDNEQKRTNKYIVASLMQSRLS